jgi:hypothetical protein
MYCKTCERGLRSGVVLAAGKVIKPENCPPAHEELFKDIIKAKIALHHAGLSDAEVGELKKRALFSDVDGKSELLAKLVHSL